jgi:hypothetical protein
VVAQAGREGSRFGGSLTVEHVRNHRGRVSISRFDECPNVLFLDRHAPTCMAAVDRNTHAVYRGRLALGEVIFHDGDQEWGWRYVPRSNRLRPSRKLHPNPLGTLTGRVRIDHVFPHTKETIFA